MLFVNDGKAEVVKLYAILDDGMGTNQYVYAAVGEAVKHILPAFALDNAREKLDADIYSFQKFVDGS